MPGMKKKKDPIPSLSSAREQLDRAALTAKKVRAGKPESLGRGSKNMFEVRFDRLSALSSFVDSAQSFSLTW